MAENEDKELKLNEGASPESEVQEEEVKEELQPEAETAATGQAQAGSSEKKDFTIDTETIKNETTSTINEVRETIKKVNLKEDTEETKGLLMEFLKNPINKLKDIVHSEHAYFKVAVILLIVWTAAAFIKDLFYIIDLNSLANFFRYGLMDSLLSLVKETISPCLTVLVLSVILMVLNKGSKKSLVSVITIVTFTKAPVIVASVFSILNILSSQFSRITSPITGLCQVISVVLLYFAAKELNGEEDDNSFIKKFVIIEAIFYGVKFVLSFMGIGI